MFTEKTLIQNCQRNDKKSQYLLVRKYSPMLMAICRRYARDQGMAQDVLQETLILIFSNIKHYKPTGSFEGWMKRIAVRASLAWIKKKYYRNEISQTDFLEPHMIAEPDIYQQLGKEQILKHIQALPDGYRVVLNLYIIEGYSHKEIADLLNISELTSRSQLSRARKSLQAKLIDYPRNASI